MMFWIQYRCRYFYTVTDSVNQYYKNDRYVIVIVTSILNLKKGAGIVRKQVSWD